MLVMCGHENSYKMTILKQGYGWCIKLMSFGMINISSSSSYVHNVTLVSTMFLASNRCHPKKINVMFVLHRTNIFPTFNINGEQIVYL
jgi:hypothetical protein